MNSLHAHNYILTYEAGVEALKTAPNDRDLQHKVVLSLARAGALNFAISEYRRYGLADVTDDEDIMALNGRLSKDLYLTKSGAAANLDALEAARKYMTAFEKTGGYYSGINSAAMALMADMPIEMVLERVAAVEATLPEIESLTAEDHYFVEATRAECFLLRGDKAASHKSLRSAIDFDPMNYSAHATTLKQFRMITEKRGETFEALSEFNPPRPIHFAGRIRLGLSAEEEAALKVSLSDTIQKNDIGSGYGALAAGGDILIAEALLEEGAMVHVILPCAEDSFVEHSVRPFGENWVQRYEACLAQATSVSILGESLSWPDPNVNRINGRFAMGQALLAGQSFSVDPAQILLYGTDNAQSYTAVHASDWDRTGYQQVILSTDATSHDEALSPDALEGLVYCLRDAYSSKVRTFKTASDAVAAAIKTQETDGDLQTVLHVDIEGDDTNLALGSMMDHGTPHSLLMSELFASLLAYSNPGQFTVTYAGRIESAPEQVMRCYTIRPA